MTHKQTQDLLLYLPPQVHTDINERLIAWCKDKHVYLDTADVVDSVLKARH